jgi:predicted phosphodiesterase
MRRHRRWAKILLLIASFGIGSSLWWWHHGRGASAAFTELPLPAVPEAAPGAGVPIPGSLTFLVTADTHLGGSGMEAANAAMLAALDELPGRPWPSPLRGVVEPPLALAVLGDLTDSGRTRQMRDFEHLYYAESHPLRGATVALSGNHDSASGSSSVGRRLIGRHGSLLRAWDWGEVRMLCLDLGPTDSALAWLEQELVSLPVNRPLIIFQHLALCGPYSGPEWLSEKRKSRYAALLAERRVLAIFHGHFHGAGHYRWQGIDVYNTGSPRHRWCEALAVRLTDDALVVASWNWQAKRWWWMHAKRRNANDPGVFTDLSGSIAGPPVLNPYPLDS